MSAPVLPPPGIDAEPESFPDHDTGDRHIDGLRAEVARQGRSIRSAQQAFTIFALLAFVLALATLLAVAFKLQAHPTMRSVTIVRPAAGAPAAGGAAAAPAPVHAVGVSLREFKLDPSTNTAASGKVTFNVANVGKVTHEFVVVRTGSPAGALPLKAGRADEAGNVGETGDLSPGRTKRVTLKLAPGHYALICNLPGHYVAGQHADLTVR
jgi:uncharacterized cupredoxin-like copper-binding protein